LSKRIIFCADGTWDSPKSDSNVVKLSRALQQTQDQVVFYDDGVGVEGNWVQRVIGGAFGEGLFHKVKDGYAKIASVYEPGDEIYIFGFSRGAYTARSIAGMIADCGLPTRNNDPEVVNKVFNAYRHVEGGREELGLLTDQVLNAAPVKMVGVWDTVGSLGIPALFGGVDPIKYGFLDTNLHPSIQNAYQALALDEHRREFPPTLWSLPKTPVPGQTVEQVWFAGVHSDVGGGYPSTVPALSDITLYWMMSKAEKLGLSFDPATLEKYRKLAADAAEAKAAALGMLHHSWNLFWGIPRRREVPDGAEISNSVAMRAAADASYRPKDLAFDGNQLSNAYKIAPVVAEAVAAATVAVAPKPAPAASRLA
jgi:uncharacterized protein (DUF2235 family)